MGCPFDATNVGAAYAAIDTPALKRPFK